MTAVGFVFAVVTLAGVGAAIARRNPLRAALGIAVAGLGAGGLVFTASGGLLGAALVLIAALVGALLAVAYVGFQNPPHAALERERPSRPGLVLAVFIFAPFLALVGGLLWERAPKADPIPRAFGAAELGRELATENEFSIHLLVLAALAAVVVAAFLGRRAR
ncbi:MAG: NADH-quinone oxidoreductase subunit J [Planctomycetota bacterium]